MASKKKSRANNHKNKRKSTAGVRGELRRQYFEEGGTLSGWRGTSSVHKSRAEKRNSRSIAKKKAIRDSQED
jgi:hypothetical protein